MGFHLMPSPGILPAPALSASGEVDGHALDWALAAGGGYCLPGSGALTRGFQGTRFERKSLVHGSPRDRNKTPCKQGAMAIVQRAASARPSSVKAWRL